MWCGTSPHERLDRPFAGARRRLGGEPHRQLCGARAAGAGALFQGPHEASGTFEIGDPNLRKEKAQTIELGLRRSQGSWRAEATAFYTRYNGFIYKRLTGLTCDDDFATCGSGGGTELRQVVFTQQDATFYGAELRGQVDVGEIAGGTFGVEGRMTSSAPSSPTAPMCRASRPTASVAACTGATRIGSPG